MSAGSDAYCSRRQANSEGETSGTTCTNATFEAPLLPGGASGSFGPIRTPAYSAAFLKVLQAVGNPFFCDTTASKRFECAMRYVKLIRLRVMPCLVMLFHS